MPTKSTALTKQQIKSLDDLDVFLATIQKSGMFSVKKLRALLRFYKAEGQSLSELERAGTQDYYLALQDLLDMGPGRTSKPDGLKLLKTVGVKDHGARKVIALTAKGKKLRDYLLKFRLGK